MSMEDGKLTLDWKTLVFLALVISGGSSGATYAWAPDPSTLVTKAEMENYVKRDELLSILSSKMDPIKDGVNQINVKLEVALNHLTNHERRISKIEANN